MRKWMLWSLLGSALVLGACQEQDRGPIENEGVGGAGPIEEQPDVGAQELPRPVDPADEGGLYEQEGLGEQEGIGGGGILEEEEEGVLEENEVGVEPGLQE